MMSGKQFIVKALIFVLTLAVSIPAATLIVGTGFLVLSSYPKESIVVIAMLFITVVVSAVNSLFERFNKRKEGIKKG